MFKKLFLIQVLFYCSVVGMELAVTKPDHFTPLVFDCKKRIVSRLGLRSIESLKCVSKQLNQEIDIEDSRLREYFRDHRVEQKNAYNYVVKYRNNQKRIRSIFFQQNNFSLLMEDFFWEHVFLWDLDLVKRFILRNNGSTVDSCDYDGRTALTHILWCQADGLQQAKLLLEIGVAVNKIDNKGDSPLSIASKSGNIKGVKLLLTEGACVDNFIGGWDRYTALMLACSVKKNSAVVKLLLAAGANVDITGNNGVTALRRACESGDMTVIELLLQDGANINLSKGGYWAPLMVACDKKNVKMVKFLIEKGANVNLLYGGSLRTALECACHYGDVEIAQLLLDAGADVTEIPEYKYEQYKEHPEIIKLLWPHISFFIKYKKPIIICVVGGLAGRAYYLWREMGALRTLGLLGLEGLVALVGAYVMHRVSPNGGGIAGIVNH